MRKLVWLAILFLIVSLNAVSEERRIERTMTLDAPIEDVWDAWTTEEGVATFFSENATIELRPGGAYEILFDMSAPEGTRGCEGCRVLAFDPPHMISFTWNAPPKFGALRQHQTHVTVHLTELGLNRTRLDFLHEGFGDSETWAEIHRYFEVAWGGQVLPRLEKRFAAVSP